MSQNDSIIQLKRKAADSTSEVSLRPGEPLIDFSDQNKLKIGGAPDKNGEPTQIEFYNSAIINDYLSWKDGITTVKGGDVEIRTEFGLLVVANDPEAHINFSGAHFNVQSNVIDLNCDQAHVHSSDNIEISSDSEIHLDASKVVSHSTLEYDVAGDPIAALDDLGLIHTSISNAGKASENLITTDYQDAGVPGRMVVRAFNDEGNHGIIFGDLAKLSSVGDHFTEQLKWDAASNKLLFLDELSATDAESEEFLEVGRTEIAFLGAKSSKQLSITAQGIDCQNIKATHVQASNFNATSDARLKENFIPFNLSTSILDLPVYQFDFIDGPKNQIGCKAQDLEKICPEIVNADPNGYLSIQESKIVYLLLEEVKKLRNEINELKRGN